MADEPPPALLENCAALLNDAEHARWQRFIYPVHQQRFLLARALVRTVLADVLDLPDPAGVQFEHNAHGKPVLAATHGNPVPLHFNLSHTDSLLVLAVCRSCPVGVDVESIHRKVDLLALSSRYFATTEHAMLQELNTVEQRERFFALWTLKEAWVKARGLGLQIPLDDFSFTFENTGPVIAFGPQLQESPGDWHLRVLRHADEFRIALAVQRPSVASLNLQIYEGQPFGEFSQV